jgi:hypothetical protein
MIRTAYKRDTLLFQTAQRVFGDIVIDAFITTWDINSSEKELIERLNNNIFTDIEDKINYDGKDIILKFVNDRMIVFTGSEWESISQMTEDFYEIF